MTERTRSTNRIRSQLSQSLLVYFEGGEHYVTLGGYALLMWLLNDGEYWLWASAAAVTLASLCRYEAWFLVALVSLVGGLQGILLWRRAERGAALRLLMIACLLAMPHVQIALPAVGVATFDDARRSISDETRFAMALGEELHAIYTEGSIALLTGYSQAQRIMISSGLPLNRFHIVYNPAEEDILGSPLNSERYLAIAKEPTPETEQFAKVWLSRREELLRYYTIRFENDHLILLERKPGSLGEDEVIPGMFSLDHPHGG